MRLSGAPGGKRQGDAYPESRVGLLQAACGLILVSSPCQTLDTILKPTHKIIISPVIQEAAPVGKLMAVVARFLLLCSLSVGSAG